MLWWKMYQLRTGANDSPTNFVVALVDVRQEGRRWKRPKRAYKSFCACSMRILEEIAAASVSCRFAFERVCKVYKANSG